jgi:prepilin-type processing-associated H-X9-DG protein
MRRNSARKQPEPVFGFERLVKRCLVTIAFYPAMNSSRKLLGTDPRFAPRPFLSPILFVDGHAAFHDFSRSLTENPYYPYEPTKDWIWYKSQPVETNSGSLIIPSITRGRNRPRTFAKCRWVNSTIMFARYC